jgi:hypothetical protein
MRGTISFVDNVPRGTVMTLRVPVNRTAAGAQSLEVQEQALTSTMAIKVAAESRQQFEQLLQSKRILVSCLCAY